MKNTLKFIDSILRNIKPTNTRKTYWCEGCPSFGLRVSPSGNKSFVYKYMVGKKSRWVTIGKYPEWSIRKARSRYDELYEQVKEYGRDPVQEIQTEKDAKRNRITVNELKEIYLDIGRQKGKVDIEREKMELERDVMPVIGSVYVDDVKPEDIETIQRNILNRANSKNKINGNYAPNGGKAAVYHILAYTRQMFNVACKKELIRSNPVYKIENYGAIGVRERVLDFREIWLFWNQIEKVGLPPVTAYALKFILATMQRGNEVRQMTYAAYKKEEKIWQMAMQDTKNRTMHRVPLNKHAIKILEEVSQYTRGSKYVFGATRAQSPVSVNASDLKPLGRSALPQAIRKKREQLGINDFSPHDLRRTAATWLAGVGLPELYSKLMLNHKESKSNTTGTVYIQYTYDFEKRKAADIWAFVLDQIIHCSKIDDVPDLEKMRQIVRESGLLNS